MEKTNIKFGDIKIEKQKLYQHKGPISVKIIDIIKTVISNKVSFGKKGFKYFFDYKDAQIKPLCIYLLKMSPYRRNFDETEYMSFFLKNEELLEKYNQIWEKG